MASTNQERLRAINHPQIHFGTSLGGLAELRNGKYYFLEAPITGEAKIGDEVPSCASMWPATSPLLDFS